MDQNGASSKFKKSLREAVQLTCMCSNQEPVKQRDDNKR